MHLRQKHETRTALVAWLARAGLPESTLSVPLGDMLDWEQTPINRAIWLWVVVSQQLSYAPEKDEAELLTLIEANQQA